MREQFVVRLVDLVYGANLTTSIRETDLDRPACCGRPSPNLVTADHTPRELETCTHVLVRTDATRKSRHARERLSVS